MKKYLNLPFLIRAGLACAFLANSLTAFTAPSEFQDLVSSSFLSHLPISAAAFVNLIAVNDLVVAILLFIDWRTRKVARWAALWLVGVILVIGVFTLDALEHLGFLLPAIALSL